MRCYQSDVVEIGDNRLSCSNISILSTDTSSLISFSSLDFFVVQTTAVIRYAWILGSSCVLWLGCIIDFIITLISIVLAFSKVGLFYICIFCICFCFYLYICSLVFQCVSYIGNPSTDKGRGSDHTHDIEQPRSCRGTVSRGVGHLWWKWTGQYSPLAYCPFLWHFAVPSYNLCTLR